MVNLDLTAVRFDLAAERFNLTMERLSLTVVNLDLTAIRFDLTVERFNLTGEKLSLTGVNFDLTAVRFDLTAERFNLTMKRLSLTAVKSLLPRINALRLAQCSSDKKSAGVGVTANVLKLTGGARRPVERWGLAGFPALPFPSRGKVFFHLRIRVQCYAFSDEQLLDGERKLHQRVERNSRICLPGWRRQQVFAGGWSGTAENCTEKSDRVEPTLLRGP
ncbi:MAG TPA: hypothetical protein VKM72_15275, partial [Thermoanaerobaculia bacterium]|nr:hypothetical protein [Thermoanaerobaculia bacterium]